MLTPELIQQRLNDHQPLAFDRKVERRAAVAMILRQGESGTEVLLIQRAEHHLDPWSGDLGFPGGRIEDEDPSARAAAERETCEEIGLHLKERHYLGRNDDLSGIRLSVNISCFVYYLDEPVEFALNRDEVSKCFWVPLKTLMQPERSDYLHFSRPGTDRQHPVIHLQEWTAKPLWGITYRLIDNFLGLFDLSFVNSERI